jgi:hypothetical protein
VQTEPLPSGSFTYAVLTPVLQTSYDHLRRQKARIEDFRQLNQLAFRIGNLTGFPKRRCGRWPVHMILRSRSAGERAKPGRMPGWPRPASVILDSFRLTEQRDGSSFTFDQKYHVSPSTLFKTTHRVATRQRARNTGVSSYR